MRAVVPLLAVAALMTAGCGSGSSSSSASAGGRDAAADTASPGGDGGASPDAEAGASSATTIADQQDKPYAIAIDATNLYWVTASSDGMSGTVVEAPLGGGPPVTLASGLSSPVGVAVDDTNVYVLHSQFRIDAVPKAGGSVSTVANVDGSFEFSDLVLDGSNLYWIELVTRSVMTVPTTGGTAVTLASQIAETPSAIAVDDANVYVAAYSPGASAGEILAIPQGDAGAGPKQLAAFDAQPMAIALDATNVYWGAQGLNGMATAKAVMKMSKQGGTPTPLGTMPSAAANGLVVDGTSAYYSFFGVDRVPLSAGAPSTLFSDTVQDGPMVADAQHLYFISGYATPKARILAIAK